MVVQSVREAHAGGTGPRAGRRGARAPFVDRGCANAKLGGQQTYSLRALPVVGTCAWVTGLAFECGESRQATVRVLFATVEYALAAVVAFGADACFDANGKRSSPAS